MSSVRLLHVDDEPDIREVVEISLALDPEFTVRSCISGSDAIAAAADWSPDLILLDVMMPEMDGPTTLANLRNSPRTADIPVVFMTARAQPREVAHFRELGAEGVISKPFDPLTLASAIKKFVQDPNSRLAGPRRRFLTRAYDDAIALSRDREVLADEANKPAVYERIKTIAHRLAGGGGIVGFAEISSKAMALEQAAIDGLAGVNSVPNVKHKLDELIAEIERV